MSMFQYSWISASKCTETDIQDIGTGSSGESEHRESQRDLYEADKDI
jgi:hypothetical protein